MTDDSHLRAAREVGALRERLTTDGDWNAARHVLESDGAGALADIASAHPGIGATCAAAFDGDGDCTLRLVTSTRQGHESYWKTAALLCLRNGEPVDIACEEGMRIFNEPVRAGGKLVGSLGFAYADAPEHSPALDAAKSQMRITARLTGEIVGLRQAERELRRQMELMEAIARKAGDGIIVLNGAGLVEFSNRAASEMLGWTGEELRDQELHAMCHYRRPDGSPYPISECAIEAVCSKGETLRDHDDVFYRKNGQPLSITCSKVPLFEDGKVVRSVLVFRDVTERKRAAEELVKTNERLALLASAAKHLLSCEHTGTFVRSLFARMSDLLDVEVFFNYLLDESGQTLRLNAFQGVPEETCAALQKLSLGQLVCGRVAEQKKPMTVQPLQDPGDGMMDPLRELGIQAYVCHPLLAGDTVLGTLSFGTRKRKRFEQEDLDLMGAFADLVAVALQRARLLETLEEQNRELGRSNDDLQQFAYVASHDLQEPLRMITNFSQLLERRYAAGLDEEAVGFLRFVTDGAKRMSRLVENLLEYALIDRLPAAPAPVSLNGALQHALTNLTAAIADSGARVTAGDLPEVPADFTQMTRLFQNLVGNAIKYRSAARPPEVRVEAVCADGSWIISVADNGAGFDSQRAQEIFEPFRRLEAEGGQPGSGIGLAICRRIMQRHGGDIWAESTPGEGSTFFFSLPETCRVRGQEQGVRSPAAAPWEVSDPV